MKKILVVDDADFILESTSTLLRFEGYDVYTASNGIEGVEAANNNKPDLILCDISMPGLDGYEVLDRIRSSQVLATTPFIFLTAFTEKANMRAGMERGADDFLVKPYTRDELIAAIDAQWNKHSIIQKHVQEQVEQVGRNITYALPHEFRTVLNQVVGSARYLKNSAQDIKPDDITEVSGDIIESAQRLLKVTENFLTYVRIESFASNPTLKAQLKNYRTDEPSALISDIIFVSSDRHERKGDLIFDDVINTITVEISSESLHKIFEELIDNAFKFSEKGSKIVIKSWLNDTWIYFSITDKGRGMTNAQISNVGAYVQFERSMYEQQGVGLGLVIAKRLVELHDGTFNIQSSEGAGTEITFCLPYIKE
ncbi:MAG: hypothetical protein QG635_838 [Bacteroidota bacterium]|nr:hypothetical protein [Bacteroidota bacterium]